MLLSLDIRTPNGGSYTIAVGSGDVEIGRAASCGVRLPYPAVSSKHLRLIDRGGEWSLRDLGSKNGTILDGRAAPAGQDIPLNDGAIVRIGELVIEAHLSNDATDGFTLTETGTVLRKLIVESLDSDGAYLESERGERIPIPDFATDLRPTDPAEFRVDRRGNGFWISPVGAGLELDGRSLPTDGAPLLDGAQLVGTQVWRFHDPLQAHVEALDTAAPAQAPVEGAAGAPGNFERIVLVVGGCAVIFATALLLVIFDVV